MNYMLYWWSGYLTGYIIFNYIIFKDKNSRYYDNFIDETRCELIANYFWFS